MEIYYDAMVYEFYVSSIWMPCESGEVINITIRVVILSQVPKSSLILLGDAPQRVIKEMTEFARYCL